MTTAIIIIKLAAQCTKMYSGLAVQAVRLLFESYGVCFSSIRRSNPLNQVVVGKRFVWCGYDGL